MGETSIGGVLVGLFLALLGIGAVFAGGFTVAETVFAEAASNRPSTDRWACSVNRMNAKAPSR